MALNSTNNLSEPLVELLEATKLQAKAEQERTQLEAARLEEEKLKRIAEEKRTDYVKEMTLKINLILEILTANIHPTNIKIEHNTLTILEVLNVLAGAHLHTDSVEFKELLYKVIDNIKSQSSNIAAPNINLHNGTTYTATDDLNITSGNDQVLKG